MIIARNKREKAQRHYVRHVRMLLPRSCEKRPILTLLRQSIAGECPEAGWELLVARFGTPEQVAASFVEGMSPQELLKALHLRQRIWRIAIILLSVVVVFMGAFVGYIAWHAFARPYGYVIISPAYVDEQPGVFEDEPPLDPEVARSLFEAAKESGRLEYVTPFP